MARVHASPYLPPSMLPHESLKQIDISMPFVQYCSISCGSTPAAQKESKGVPGARCSVCFFSQEVKTRQSQAKQERKRLCVGMCRAVADHLSIIWFHYSFSLLVDARVYSRVLRGTRRTTVRKINERGFEGRHASLAGKK